MRVSRVSIKNFMCIEEADFLVPESGFILVSGEYRDNLGSNSNESGKTALLEAVYWALVDETPRGLKKSDVIKDGSAGCVVQVELTEGKKKILVTRSRGKSGNDLTVTGLATKGIQDSQPALEKLLSINSTKLSHINFFSQDMEVRFSNLTDVNRKSMIEEVTGLTEVEVARKSVSEEALTVRKKLLVAETRSKSTQEELETNTEQRDSFGKRLEEEEQERSKSILELSAQIKEREQELTRSVEVLHSKVSAVATSKKELERLEREAKGVANERLEVECRLREIVEETRSVAGERDKVEELRSEGKCGYCGSKIKGDYGEALFTSAKATLKRLESEQGRIEAKIAILQAGRERLEREGRDWRKSGEVSQRELQEATRAESELQTTLKSMCQTLEALQGEKKSSTAALLEELRQREIELESELKQYQQEVSVFGTSLSYLDELQKIFSPEGFRSFVSQGALEYLNDRLSYYSGLLTDDEGLIELRDKELKNKSTSKEIGLYCANGEYKRNSSGKRRRVDLAVQFAFSDLVRHVSGESLEFLVVDEVLDKLDVSGLDRVLGLLVEKAETMPVFIVAHNEVLVDLLEQREVSLQRFRVIRQGSSSRLEVEK